MFYVKNVPQWERILRIIAGMGFLAYAYANWGSSSVGVGAGIVGAMFAMTGLMGYCPMCAMAGRRPIPRK